MDADRLKRQKDRARRYGPTEVLEGPPAETVLITTFPTADDARRWYNSPEYQAAREHRFRGADYRVILTETPDSP
ncbi:DUF1330 domain-containing protein [Phenylobacterium sp.]|uniref:DUF1330 domain-containing protein n=1 Tax=Phenylobacterium sp. TaxID=1871053 RepID=UPI003525D8AC